MPHWDGMTGDLLELPPSRHRLDALEDSAILLSVVKPEALDSADDRDKRR